VIDLGNWAAGKYSIPVAVNSDPDEDPEEQHEK
jgi:endogenous inhibitor of DNA gyrase (YacG/DUF329 family)